MQFLGLSLLFAFASATDDEICERGALQEVTRCTVAGDPHFTMFNKQAHDMQGEDQYYYVKKCCDVDSDDMPFAILGKHHRIRHPHWGGHVSTLDYLTLELTDDKDRYYVHISRDIYCYYNEDDALSDENKTLYDSNAAVCEAMTDGSLYLIGDRFKLRVLTHTNDVIAIALTIDDDDKVTMRMTPTKNALLIDEKRCRMHALVIDPFEAYKCYSCGLCGNFRNTLPSFETCDGGNVTVIKGWAPTNPFAYDITGNTYSSQYCDADTSCATKKKKYKCNKGDKEIPEICKAKIYRKANKKCKKAVADVWECCATLDDDGGCDLAIAECTVDACAEAEDEDDLNVMVANALYDDATALCQGMDEEDLDEEIATVIIGDVFGEPVTPVVNYVIAAAAVCVVVLAVAFVVYKQRSGYKALL